MSAPALHDCQDRQAGPGAGSEIGSDGWMAGLRRRWFAACLRRLSAPHRAMLEPWKRRLLTPLSGTVVELGPGTGVNLPFLTGAERWIAVEPNPHLHGDLLRAARKWAGRRESSGARRTWEIRGLRAEGLDLPDGSADAVVATLVMCSVRDPGAVVREAWRVLRPGRRFVVIEHVAAAAGTTLCRSQVRWKPFFRWLGDGCEPDRRTRDLPDWGRFREVTWEAFDLPIPVAGPHVAGTAVK